MEKNQTHIFMPASMKFSQYAITLKRQCEISTTVEQASVFWLVLKVLNWADRHQGKDKTCGNTSSITLRRHFRKPQNLNELFSLVLHLINCYVRGRKTQIYTNYSAKSVYQIRQGLEPDRVRMQLGLCGVGETWVVRKASTLLLSLKKHTRNLPRECHVTWLRVNRQLCVARLSAEECEKC